MKKKKIHINNEYDYILRRQRINAGSFIFSLCLVQLGYYFPTSIFQLQLSHLRQSSTTHLGMTPGTQRVFNLLQHFIRDLAQDTRDMTPETTARAFEHPAHGVIAIILEGRAHFTTFTSKFPGLLATRRATVINPVLGMEGR